MKLMNKIMAAVLLAALLTSCFAVSALAAQTVKATGDVNLRSGAGLKYSVIDTMLTGKTATYQGKSSKDSRGVTWYKVKFNGKTGWVSSKYAKLSGSGSGSSSGSRKGTAKVNLNVRSGPGTTFRILTTIAKGKTVTYQKDAAKDKSGRTWYYVSYGDIKGWVCGNYIKK